MRISFSHIFGLKEAKLRGNARLYIIINTHKVCRLARAIKRKRNWRIFLTAAPVKILITTYQQTKKLSVKYIKISKMRF